jgi:hypothetical protein
MSYNEIEASLEMRESKDKVLEPRLTLFFVIEMT